MNTQTTTPGYHLQVRNPVQANRNQSFSFRDTNLLNARQAAMQKAQQLVSEKQSYEVIDVTIDLIEIERNTVPNRHKVIATVFQQRFGRTAFMDEGKDLLVEMQLDALTKKSLPPALFLTIDLTRDEDACNSPTAVWDSLTEMTCEYDYYISHGYKTGFGSVQLALSGPHLPLPKDLSTLSDEELHQQLEILKQPNRLFRLLYDGLAHATNRICHYNQHYATGIGSLHFSSEFLP